MSTSLPADSGQPVERPARRRTPRIKKKKRMPAMTLYAIVFAVLIGVLILLQVGFHMARTDPRDTRAIAERELTLNTLQPGEPIVHMVSVFKRPALNYFRATRGLLVLTDRRLLYLGLEPRDLLAAPDLPPTFEERDFPLDTTVTVAAGRTFFGLARAVVIKTPNETLRLGIPSTVWPSANVLVSSMEVRHERAVAASARQKELLAKTEAQREAAEEARHQARYYVVRRGDAIGSIATQWNATIDQLRAWNELPDNRIRVGQRLLVRPAL